MGVLLEVEEGEEEEEEVAVQGESRRETGGQVGEEAEEGVEVQNRVGQTLLNSSNPSTREATAAAAKAGSTTATVKRRTSLASRKGEQAMSILNIPLADVTKWSNKKVSI